MAGLVPLAVNSAAGVVPMVRILVVALCLAPLAASAQTPKQLVGRYQMEASADDVMELRADGTATMAGEETRWSAKGGMLTIGPDNVPYRLTDGRLLLQMGQTEFAWRKLGATSKGSSPLQRAASRAQQAPGAVEPQDDPGSMAPPPPPARGARQHAPAPGGGSQDDRNLRQLLTRSAWCAFSYNQVSGTSTKQRVAFAPDGTASVNGGAETYNSGANGSYAGQSENGGTVRWKVENARLFMDQGQGFGDVGLTIQKNSNGYPILKADGREYMMCK
jgi:hypothetical protein